MKDKYGFVVWFVASLFMIYSFSLNTAAGVFSEPIQKALNLTSSQATIAVSCFVIGFALFQIPAGILLDKFNNRIVLCFAILILSLGCFLTALSKNLLFYSLANIVQGIGASFAFTAVGKAVSCWFSITLFPIMFGLSQTLSCFLSGAIHVALSRALEVMSWNKVYIILTGAGVIVFLMNLLFFRSGRAGASGDDNAENAEMISLFPSLLKVVKNRQVWICTIVASFSFGTLLAYSGFWYSGITKHYHVGITPTSVIGILLFTGIGIGTPLWGAVSNWVKTKKIVMHVTLSVGLIFMILVVYLPHYHFESQLIAYVNNFFVGLLLSSAMLSYSAIAEMLPPEVTGMAIAFVNMFVFIVNTIYLSLPYSLFIKGADFQEVYWLFPVSIALSICFLVFIKEESYHKINCE